MTRNIYVVQDIVSDEIVSSLMLFNRDEPAIRAFADTISGNDSLIGKHPKDFQLVCLGSMSDDLAIVANVRIVITGGTVLATQTYSGE